MTEHTPTPWCVEASDGEMDSKAKFETGSKVLIVSDDCEYHPVADCSCNHSCRMPFEQEANAAFIVKACNAYADLVEALEKIADMDPHGIRADDLGRAARVAHEAILAAVSTPSDDA